MSKITTGPIGTINIGDEQVGGFISWEMAVNIRDREHPRTLVAARAVWLFKDIPSSEVELMLYDYDDKGDLVMVQQSAATIKTTLGEVPDGVLVHTAIEMEFKHGG